MAAVPIASASSASSSSCGLNSASKNHVIIKFHSVASTPPIFPFPTKRQHIGTDECDQFCAKISARPFLKCGRTRVSFFQKFSSKGGEEDVDSRLIKQELLQAIAPLDRGAQATPQDHERVDQIAGELEAGNRIKEPLKSSLLNGKWELLYTTSQSILQTQRPKLLRPNGKIYQAINLDTLRAQNMETWPFFNQATANLVPLNEKRVAVKFDSFKIAGVIPIGARGSGRGQLEITYLDEELRISRGNQGNLFILRMVDPSYKVPL